MAYAIIADVPNGSPELDEEMSKRLNYRTDPPAGAIARFTGSHQGTWRIFSVWESKEAWEKFRRDRLEPALRETGRPVPAFDGFPLESVFIPNKVGV